MVAYGTQNPIERTELLESMRRTLTKVAENTQNLAKRARLFNLVGESLEGSQNPVEKARLREFAKNSYRLAVDTYQSLGDRYLRDAEKTEHFDLKKEARLNGLAGTAYWMAVASTTAEERSERAELSEAAKGAYIEGGNLYFNAAKNTANPGKKAKLLALAGLARVYAAANTPIEEGTTRGQPIGETEKTRLLADAITLYTEAANIEGIDDKEKAEYQAMAIKAIEEQERWSEKGLEKQLNQQSKNFLPAA